MELNFKYSIPTNSLSNENLTLECYAYYVGAFNYNWHDHVECLVVLNGSLEACVGGETYYMVKNDICFIDSRKGHATLSKSKDTVAIVLHFNPELIQLNDKESHKITWFGVTDDYTRNSTYSINIRKCLKMIVDSFLEDDILSFTKRNMATHIFLFESLSNFAHIYKTEPNKEIRNYEDKTVRKMLKYLNENYTEKIKLSDLAKVIGYHPNYTSELFSKQIGIPFTEYLHRYRLREATKDLKQSDKLISDIALEHGFSNVKAFNTLFRENFGRSPSEYKSSLEKDIIEIDAEFKKVFLSTEHEYWNSASRKWLNENNISKSSKSIDNEDTQLIKNQTYDKLIELIKELKKY